MCSILGVIHKNPSLKMDLNEFIEINKSLNHRGPDDSGVCKIGSSILGHNRLSIIGLKSKYSYIVWLFLALESWHNVFIDSKYEFIQK
jgi:asparagine synthetase B (glutamine-hydrolysing)